MQEQQTPSKAQSPNPRLTFLWRWEAWKPGWNFYLRINQVLELSGRMVGLALARWAELYVWYLLFLPVCLRDRSANSLRWWAIKDGLFLFQGDLIIHEICQGQTRGFYSSTHDDSTQCQALCKRANSSKDNLKMNTLQSSILKQMNSRKI